MADDDKPKKGGKLKWILLVLLILLLGGGGYGAWLYFMGGQSQTTTSADNGQAAPARSVKTPPQQDLQITALDPFLVNLNDPLGKRYIKVTFEVEVVSPAVIEELNKQKPRIKDSLITLLSSKTYADLMPVEAKMNLKDEVTNRLNQILGGQKVTRVFFTDMVIQ